MLNCPACHNSLSKDLVRRATFDCPGCGVALKSRPNAISVWSDRLNRISWWAVIFLFLADRAWLGRHVWAVLLTGLGLALALDLLCVLFPPAGFVVTAPALPAQYWNLAPLSNHEYDQRSKTIRPLGIT